MIFLLLIYALVAWLTIPELIKKKEWRDLTAFLVFYTVALILGLIYVLDIPIPSAMKGLQYLISDVLGIKYS